MFNGDANGDTTTFNDIAFIPATADQVIVTNGTWDQLNAYLSADPAAKNNRGMVPNRNTGTSPWTNQLDVRYAVTVPAGQREGGALDERAELPQHAEQELGAGATSRTSTRRRRSATAASTRRPGKEIINMNTVTGTNFLGTFTRDDLRSRWQAQWEARIRF